MEKELRKGNEAIAEAAIACGCRYFFGYPITPQNEIPEYMAFRLPEVGGVFIQSESEVAAINMVYGAAGSGARVMTSSSGPGISLKMEGISYLCGAELPCVIVNIMRAGPGLGGIQPSQSDYFQMTKGGGHGDYHCLVYSPSTIQEAADLTQLAFDKADEYRMPVFILGDGFLGQMMEPVVIHKKEAKFFDKSWAATGWKDKSRPRAVINSLYLDPGKLEAHNLKLQEKYKKITETETMSREVTVPGAEILVVAYGSTARIAQSAIDDLLPKGVKCDLFCPLTLWPFPEKELQKAAMGKKAVLVTEMSSGQMLYDVRLSLSDKLPIHFYGRMGGMAPSSGEIASEILKIKEAL